MKKAAIFASMISVLFSTGFDTPDGAPIRQGVHIEWYRTVAPGNDGEAIFVWSDTRYGMRNIFAHKIDQNGQLLWGDQGAIVTDLPGRQEDPVAITDGGGGAFIAWVDYRFDEQGDIFLQHLDNDGETLLDGNGVALAQVEGKQITINMCTDSLGGVFVTWQDKRSGIDDDIYGTHVTADHAIVSPGTGVPIVVEGGNQNAKTIEYAGSSEAFIAWVDSREGANADVYGQRLNIAMEGLFQENGIPIASTDEQELKPRATFVQGNTSFITWKEGDENSKVFYQHVDQEGLVFDAKRAISDNDALQTAPRVKKGSTGDVFVNWKDLRDDPIDGDQYFQKIDVNEPSVEDTVKILRGLKPYYEEHHQVRYTAEALRAAVELSNRYIGDRKLPDKAIDVIDEVGASQMLVSPSKRKKTLGVRDVENVIATMARIPPKQVSKDDKLALSTLERDLKMVVFGQDKAINSLASAIKLARAGLREAEKPIGSYLFSGPTGVGKTEVARQLANTLGIELVRFDMSEYMERHSVSRLIGAPPGYVGFDQGGMLTDAVDQNPHAVLLLDEIEKAHPDVFNILLQIMDYGKLTDHNSKTVDFRNVILIMTTNVSNTKTQAKMGTLITKTSNPVFIAFQNLICNSNFLDLSCFNVIKH